MFILGFTLDVFPLILRLIGNHNFSFLISHSSFKIVLSSLHRAPMDGMLRTVVITSQTIGTTAIMLPVWWQSFYIIDRT